MGAAVTQAEMPTIDAPFERHGGRMDDAARAFPDAPRPWIDLSTGINPVPWRAPPDLAVDPAPLPTATALRALEAAAAGCFGVDPALVAAVPGSEIALRLLPALGLPRPIVAATPCYATHRDVADALRAADRGAAPGATMLLANPNNPDGRATSPARLRDLAAAQAAAGGWLVVDEAFADATPEISLLPRWDGAGPLVVTRSFGKFFGLAGVRLGFVVAPPAILARLRGLLGDWPVGAQAIAWGTAAYADDRWIAATRTRLAETAARLDALLGRHGIPAGGATPLFRTVIHPEARRIFATLARAGILVRPFADRPDRLRFGLPADDAAFDRLARALAGG